MNSNGDSKVEKLINSILEIERTYIRDHLSTEPAAKKTAVKAILDEVEKVMKDEDQNS